MALLANLHRLARVTFALSMSAYPVLCLPCGFADGMPLDLQVMGKPRGEEDLLAIGATLEKLFGVAEKLPIDPDKRRSRAM